jgi:predicted DNA-binding protein
MSSDRITIRIPEELGARLRHRSRTSGQTESDLVRIALEKYLGRSGREWSAFELAEQAGLVGCVPGSSAAPAKDLSTYTRYFSGFGNDK